MQARGVRSLEAPPQAASKPPSDPSQKDAADASDELLIEQQLAKRRPKPKTPPPPPGSYKVISAARDQVYGGGPLTVAQQFENGIISFLGLLFFVILGEGIFLAASGFLDESADAFAQNVVYPAFSPTIILFLAGSTLYGLWKTGGLRGGDATDGNKE